MSVYLYAVPLLKARETNESKRNEAGEGGSGAWKWMITMEWDKSYNKNM